MAQRLWRFRSSLWFMAAGPCGLLAWVMPEQYATWALGAAVLAAMALVVGLMWLSVAYALYLRQRRQYRRVLAAEGAWHRGEQFRRTLRRVVGKGLAALPDERHAMPAAKRPVSLEIHHNSDRVNKPLAA